MAVAACRTAAAAARPVELARLRPPPAFAYVEKAACTALGAVTLLPVAAQLLHAQGVLAALGDARCGAITAGLRLRGGVLLLCWQLQLLVLPALGWRMAAGAVLLITFVLKLLLQLPVAGLPLLRGGRDNETRLRGPMGTEQCSGGVQTVAAQ